MSEYQDSEGTGNQHEVYSETEAFMNIQVRLSQLLLNKVFSYHRLPDKHFFTLLLQHSWSRTPPVVKPNSFFLLRWGLFFHPGPTLPSWARITYLSPPLLLLPGRGNHTSLRSQCPKSTVYVLHPHSQGWFHGRKNYLFSWLGTPHEAVLTSPLQFWTTFFASLGRNVSESLQQALV